MEVVGEVKKKRYFSLFRVALRLPDREHVRVKGGGCSNLTQLSGDTYLISTMEGTIKKTLSTEGEARIVGKRA